MRRGQFRIEPAIFFGRAQRVLVTTPRETERIGNAQVQTNVTGSKRIRHISRTRLKPDLISQGLSQATASKTQTTTGYMRVARIASLRSSVCPKGLPQWAALVWHVGAHLDRVMRPLCVWLDPACAASCWPALAARHLWPDQTRPQPEPEPESISRAKGCIAPIKQPGRCKGKCRDFCATPENGNALLIS